LAMPPVGGGGAVIAGCPHAPALETSEIRKARIQVPRTHAA
jgi:hypothetical protein